MTRLLPARLTTYLATVEPGTVAAILPRDPIPGTATSKLATLFDSETATRFDVLFTEQSISRITVDLDTRIVEKQVGRFSEFGILEREARWLEILSPYAIAPNLVSAKDDTLRLSYVGEPVRKHNLPADWRTQAERILSGLALGGCAHNDIKCDNLTVLDGRLYLIDFGWSTEVGAPIPTEWPAGIGRQHRLGIHRFDDRIAIYAALESAERDEVDRSIVMPMPVASP